MKIILDAMGGDNAPQATVEGALQANREQGAQIILVGRTEAVLQAMKDCGQDQLPAGIEIRNATEVVEISDDPALAFKMKKDSSLTVGLTMLRDGEGDAFISAGSTGALLAGATLVVKRIKGIRRAAMAPQIPNGAGGQFILCDCGANAECTPEYLLQFAFLGSFYAQRMMGVKNPRVGLLNIGAEEEKGDALRRETLAVLKEASAAGRICFIGNVEASAAIMGGADVLVADGFSGNVMLKSMEGAAHLMGRAIKGVFLKSLKNKLAALALKNDFQATMKLLDSTEIGGTPFLGISKPVLKAHGSSNAKAICNAVKQAQVFASSGFIQQVEKNSEYMKIAAPRENA